jgi:hypothetical protein
VQLVVAIAGVLAACAVETAGLGTEDGDTPDATATRDSGMDAEARDTAEIDARAGDSGVRDARMNDAPVEMLDAGAYDVIDLECETGTRNGAMQVVTDGRAFGGAAVVVAAGSAPDWTPTGELPPDRVELPMTLRGGDYDVWIYFYAHDAAHDALYAGFGAGDMRRFYHRTWGTYQWRRGNDDDLRVLHFAGVPAGTHTLSIGLGETEVRCDRVIVTNDPTLEEPPAP